MFLGVVACTPPAKIPLVELDAADVNLRPTVKFPKSVALPAVVKVTKFMVSELEPTLFVPPPNIPLVELPHPPGLLSKTSVRSPKSVEFPAVVIMILLITLVRDPLKILPPANKPISGTAGGLWDPLEIQIQYITIASTGNALDFGDLTVARGYLQGASGTTKMTMAGGFTSVFSTYTNTIDTITIASTGNATDFGDLSVNQKAYAGTSNSHGGLS